MLGGRVQQACESPLLVAVAAGSVALPTLLKLATVMAAKNQDLLSCSQLPVVRLCLHWVSPYTTTNRGTWVLPSNPFHSQLGDFS